MSLVSEQWAASRANPRRVFFIDSENGITGLIEGVQYLNSTDKVIVFHRDDIPQGTRARICKTPATVEWVACVDPKMKNSMDVQIIAELSAQLEADRFDSAYIVSNDKGYLLALHYLQKTPRGRGHALERISSIERVIVDSTFRFLETLRTAESVSELRYSLTVMLGEREANRILNRFGTLLAKKKANGSAQAGAALQRAGGGSRIHAIGSDGRCACEDVGARRRHADGAGGFRAIGVDPRETAGTCRLGTGAPG